jgi:hypothetical protein
MISRSESGPRCPHCTKVNPAIILEPSPSNIVVCMHCNGSFKFWIERLPFYTTDDGRAARCDCDVCTGKAPVPGDERPPEDRSDG